MYSFTDSDSMYICAGFDCYRPGWSTILWWEIEPKMAQSNWEADKMYAVCSSFFVLFYAFMLIWKLIIFLNVFKNIYNILFCSCNVLIYIGDMFLYICFKRNLCLGSGRCEVVKIMLCCLGSMFTFMIIYWKENFMHPQKLLWLKGRLHRTQ